MFLSICSTGVLELLLYFGHQRKKKMRPGKALTSLHSYNDHLEQAFG